MLRQIDTHSRSKMSTLFMVLHYLELVLFIPRQFLLRDTENLVGLQIQLSQLFCLIEHLRKYDA